MSEAPLSLTVPGARRRGISIRERRLVLMTLDAVSVALALVLAFNLRSAEVKHVGFYIPRLGTLTVLGLWAVSGTIVDAWSVRAVNSVRTTVTRVSVTTAFTTVGLLIVFLIVPYQITRPTLILWAPIAWGLVMGERLGYRRLVAVSSPPTQIALVADRSALNRVWPEVSEQIRGLYHVAAVVNPHRDDAMQRLCATVETRAVSEVVLGLRDDIDRPLFRGILACHDAGVRVRSLADLYEELTGRLLLDQLGHTWLLGLPMRGDTSHIYAVLKRSLDVAVAAVTLAALGCTLPLLAPLIKLDRGPIFHRQARIGKHGRTFNVIKLRTMRHSPHAPTTWTAPSDARITRVGKVLRRLHVDEFPQAWAVLRGDMSLIGPRPEQPRYAERLRCDIDFYNTRHTVRPGLTGWAQVNAGYGGSVDDARVKLSYDLYYVKHQSLSLDLIILARTVMTMLSLSGR